MTADTDFTITGRLARFGRGGMIEDISNRLLRDFADCLKAMLESRARGCRGHPRQRRAGGARPRPAAPPPQAKPVQGMSLFFSVLWERIKRLVRHFGPQRRSRQRSAAAATALSATRSPWRSPVARASPTRAAR